MNNLPEDEESQSQLPSNPLIPKDSANSLAFSLRSSPIPDPDTLRDYETVVPGFAKELLNSFLAESQHRRQMESELLELEKQNLTQEGWLMKANSNRSFWGLIAGFIISISALISSVYVTIQGYPWVGGVIGGTTVVSLAGVFVIGKFQEKKESETNTKELTEE